MPTLTLVHILHIGGKHGLAIVTQAAIPGPSSTTCTVPNQSVLVEATLPSTAYTNFPTINTKERYGEATSMFCPHSGIVLHKDISVCALFYD